MLIVLPNLFVDDEFSRICSCESVFRIKTDLNAYVVNWPRRLCNWIHVKKKSFFYPSIVVCVPLVLIIVLMYCMMRMTEVDEIRLFKLFGFFVSWKPHFGIIFTTKLSNSILVYIISCSIPHIIREKMNTLKGEQVVITHCTVRFLFRLYLVITARKMCLSW